MVAFGMPEQLGIESKILQEHPSQWISSLSSHSTHSKHSILEAYTLYSLGVDFLIH